MLICDYFLWQIVRIHPVIKACYDHAFVLIHHHTPPVQPTSLTGLFCRSWNVRLPWRPTFFLFKLVVFSMAREKRQQWAAEARPPISLPTPDILHCVCISYWNPRKTDYWIIPRASTRHLFLWLPVFSLTGAVNVSWRWVAEPASESCELAKAGLILFALVDCG